MWLTYVDGVVASAVTPIGAATGDLVSYILGYGVLGVLVIAFAFRFIVPARLVDEAKEQARVDLVAENTRLIAQVAKVEEQRDAAMQIAQERLVPLLTSFVATSQSLLPLLQEIVRKREG